ncbi:hypothetical protein BDV18DRAFT_158807 [Aspergillus unguis]
MPIELAKERPKRVFSAPGDESNVIRRSLAELVWRGAPKPRVLGKWFAYKGVSRSTATSTPSSPSLQEESERANADIERSKAFISNSPPSSRTSPVGFRRLSTSEIYENRINLQHGETVHQQTVRGRSDIHMPARPCSQALLRHGFIWTSWIHFATHTETFELEHDAAWESGLFLDGDPLWLAIYFGFIAMSLMFMTESEAFTARLPEVNTSDLIRNWYDAAIYFLNKADYLRNYNLRTVQAIAILLGLGKSVGDFNSQPLLQATGIRIGQIIGMDREPPLNGYALDDPVIQEVSRRTWWTLIICEWLSVPPRPPCIQEIDFTVNIPLILTDKELSNIHLIPTSPFHPRQIEYHLALIAIAKTIYRFQYHLARLGDDDTRILEDLVLATDEDLATIIAQLPPHLSEARGSEPSNCNNDNNDHSGWIAWQWRNLTLTLLIFRMRVNRCLQDRWPHMPDDNALLARSKAICLECATTVILLVDRNKNALSRHRPWAMTFYVFSAAMTLAIEVSSVPRVEAAEYIENIKLSLSFFEFLQDHSALAKRANDVLLEFLRDIGLCI